MKTSDRHGRADPVHAADLILDVVGSIPRGRVATYGQVARLAGLRGQARLVGTVLGQLPTPSPIPWHRVINAGGRISLPSDEGAELQRAMLEHEGIVFGRNGRIDLDVFGWDAG